MKNGSRGNVTLKQVAEEAGVSLYTASRALSGKAAASRITPKTEQAVVEAAKKLGYRPSRAAQTLATNKTGLLGIVVPDAAMPFFASIAREVTIAAEEQGLSVLLADSRETTANEATAIDELCARQIEGLVVCPVGLESAHLEQLTVAGLPVVLVDRVFRDSGISTITSDHRAGAVAITQMLIDAGHEHIGVLQGLPGVFPNDERIVAVRDTLRGAGLGLPDDAIAGEAFCEESGYRSTMRMLDRRPQTTALFALSSQNVAGALRAAQERQLAIPDDISIAAYDDQPLAKFLAAPLTVADQDVAQLGRLAAKRIVQLIAAGPNAKPTHQVVPVSLVERASIARRR